MKLRNKKTGEIVEYDSFYLHKVNSDGHEDFEPNTQTLAELNDEWEDYEEPKEDGLDNIITLVEAYSTNDSERYPKEVVEKLKAWKRLKDKGFRFTDYDYTTYNGKGCGQVFFNEVSDNINEIKDDLDLLFGGKE